MVSPNYLSTFNYCVYSVPLKFDYNEVEPSLTQPACLPAQGVEQQDEGTLCWTAGWGRLEWRGQSANVLQEVDVKLISDKQCMTLETASIFNPVKNKSKNELSNFC